jgi:hypothetical protein
MYHRHAATNGLATSTSVAIDHNGTRYRSPAFGLSHAGLKQAHGAQRRSPNTANT